VRGGGETYQAIFWPFMSGMANDATRDYAPWIAEFPKSEQPSPKARRSKRRPSMCRRRMRNSLCIASSALQRFGSRHRERS
jgi:hypothetical protein